MNVRLIGSVPMFFQTDPGIGGNEGKSSRTDVALLIAEPNVGRSAVDEQNFVLGQVLVLRDARSWRNLFRSQDEVQGTVVLWADLQHKLAGRNRSAVGWDAASAQFAVILFKEKPYTG